MTEQQNLPNFAACPPLEKHPKILNPDAANKESKLNQNLKECADWLRDNKDKAGSSEYEQHFLALQTMADKDYPMAQFEYAKILMDIGDIHHAGIYFEKAKHNENADSKMAQEIRESSPHIEENQKEQGLEDTTKQHETDEKKLKRNPFKIFHKNSYQTDTEAKTAIQRFLEGNNRFIKKLKESFRR